MKHIYSKPKTIWRKGTQNNQIKEFLNINKSEHRSNQHNHCNPKESFAQLIHVVKEPHIFLVRVDFFRLIQRHIQSIDWVITSTFRHKPKAFVQLHIHSCRWPKTSKHLPHLLAIHPASREWYRPIVYAHFHPEIPSFPFQ